MGITASRSAPYVEVEFHTKDKLYAVSRGGDGWSSIQPTRDLLSVQTNKQIGNPLGTWQVTLTGARDGRDGMDWYDRLLTNNLVVIKMGRPPETMGTVMVGLVDEIRRLKTMGADGTPEVRVLVRGSDFGKVLARAMLRFYPALANAPEVSADNFYSTGAGWLTMFNFFVGSDLIQGTPPEMIQQAIVKILYRIMNITYQYWDTKDGQREIHLSNILRYRLAETKQLIPFLLTMLDYEGAFWNFIERVSMKPFNELFIDTRGEQPDEKAAGKTPEYLTMVPNAEKQSYYVAGDPLAAFMKENNIESNPNWAPTFGEDGAKVILYLRNTPFDYADWNALYTHEVDYGDITSEDIGRADHENYNVYMVTNSLSIPSQTNLKLLVPPVMDEANAKAYGMSPLEITLEGISIDEDRLNDGVAASKELSQKLYEWYKWNKDYKTGTITMRGNAFIKIGQRLVIRACEYNMTTGKFDDLVFYIEGVQQNFTNMETWQTTLTITRGQRFTTTKPQETATTATMKAAAQAPTTQTSGAAVKPANSKTHTVVSGESLWKLADKYYGSGTQWRKIWNANSEALIARDPRNKKNPGHFIYPGQKLIIPD